MWHGEFAGYQYCVEEYASDNNGRLHAHSYGHEFKQTQDNSALRILQTVEEMTMNVRLLRGSLIAAFAAAALVGLVPDSASANGGSNRLKPPTLTCVDATQVSVDVKVCAGSSGTPAGFVLKWLEGDTWPATSDDACFSYFWTKGRGHLLAPGACITVSVGELLATEASRTTCSALLQCGTSYAFKGWARATPTKGRSVNSEALYCSTLPCTPPGKGCTYTQGYWDTHGPDPKGGNDYTWPEPPRTAGLSLGTVPYMPTQLQSILREAPKGNGLVSLAHQLIAAKLNIANGADDSAIAATITAADALIGALVIPPVGTGSLSPSQTSTLNDTLTDYNEGAIGPGHCDSTTSG